jgi:hypothetical protein
MGQSTARDLPLSHMVRATLSFPAPANIHNKPGWKLLPRHQSAAIDNELRIVLGIPTLYSLFVFGVSARRLCNIQPSVRTPLPGIEQHKAESSLLKATNAPKAR